MFMKGLSNKLNLEADVAIVGGGGAGLMAAISAARAGAKRIIILEKTDTLGGNTSLSHGIFAVDSPTQKRLGIKLSKDAIFKDKMTYSNWRLDARLVRTIIDQSANIIAWFESRGIKFDQIIQFPPEKIGPRVFHTCGGDHTHTTGARIIELLTKECNAFDNIYLSYGTAVKKIITDGKGKVVGVKIEKQGNVDIIAAKSIVLATGGFGGNKEMLNKYFPLYGEIYCNSLSQMTGDGLIMAAEVGAFIDNDIVILLMGPHHYPLARSLGIMVRRPEVLLVNKNGERIMDESIASVALDRASNCLGRQPYMTCYALLDSMIKTQIMRSREPISGLEKAQGDNGAWVDELDNDLKRESAKGKAKTADSWDDIAKYIGADPRTLKSTVTEYNYFCEEHYDADFLKDKKYLSPLCEPPYYAITGWQGFDTTLGGIRINHHMEVIGTNFQPIAGFYAAGDNASGCESINYNHKYPGSALCFALVSGYLAGENAAKYACE